LPARHGTRVSSVRFRDSSLSAPGCCAPGGWCAGCRPVGGAVAASARMDGASRARLSHQCACV